VREFGWVRREDGGSLAPEVRKGSRAAWLRTEVVAPACPTRTFELTGIRVLEECLLVSSQERSCELLGPAAQRHSLGRRNPSRCAVDLLVQDGPEPE
jgi:hypothetical protein